MHEFTKNGHRFVVNEIANPDSFMGKFWEHVQSGVWEPYTYDIFDALLSKDLIYLDLGAWVGPTVLYASTLCKRCYALEPDPVAYRQLCANVAANGIQNIVCLNEAILDYDGVVTLGSESLGNSMTRLGSKDNLFQVPCRTLGSFVREQGIVDPMFIKMDIEGAEERVLKSVEFFAKWKPTLYVSLHKGWLENPTETLAIVHRISLLYNHCYDILLNKTSVDDRHEGFVLSDRAVMGATIARV